MQMVFVPRNNRVFLSLSLCVHKEAISPCPGEPSLFNLIYGIIPALKAGVRGREIH